MRKCRVRVVSVSLSVSVNVSNGIEGELSKYSL
jgi:hypothetical protein